MNDRRLVGIDLGIASAHTVRVLDGHGKTLAKRKACPTVESLTEVETAALAGAPAGTRLEVVIEPTGPAWLPIAVFFTARGHRGVPGVLGQGGGPAPVPVPAHQDQRHRRRHPGPAAAVRPRRPASAGAARRRAAALDRRVRATDRLTRAGAEHKVRIKDLVRQLMPMTPLTGDLGAADLAVLERWADPNALVRLGVEAADGADREGLEQPSGAERAERGSTPPGGDRALRRPSRGRLRRPGRRGRHRGPAAAGGPGRARPHAAERERPTAGSTRPAWPAPCPAWPRSADPHWWRRWATRPGSARGKQFRSFTGLVPEASETGDTDRKGQPMSKAGSSLLRTTLIRAADTRPPA